MLYIWYDDILLRDSISKICKGPKLEAVITLKTNQKLLRFQTAMNITNLGNQLLTNIQTEIQLNTSHSHKCFQCLTVHKYHLISVTVCNPLYSRNCGKLLIYFHHRKLIFDFLYHLKTSKFKRLITAHYLIIKTFIKVWKVNKN